MDYWLRRVIERTPDLGVSYHGIIKDLCYADDVVIFAEMTDVIIHALRTMNTEATPLGLQINWEKTKIQALGSSNLQGPTLTINSDTNIEAVNGFVYLGSKIVNCCSCSPEIRRRLSLAHNALGRLSNVWKSSFISSALKLRLLNAIVVPIFLYGSET